MILSRLSGATSVFTTSVFTNSVFTTSVNDSVPPEWRDYEAHIQGKILLTHLQGKILLTHPVPPEWRDYEAEDLNKEERKNSLFSSFFFCCSITRHQ